MKLIATQIGQSPASDLQVLVTALPDLESQLSDEDRAGLAGYEQLIENGLNAFFEVGHALAEIKRKRLYRNEFATFDEYCRARWDMGRFYAYRLLKAAEVRASLLTIVNKVPLPENEAQIRPLVPLPAHEAKEAWENAVAQAPNGRITGTIVSAAVREVLGKRILASQERDYWQVTVTKLLKDALIAVKAGDRLEAIEKVQMIQLHLGQACRVTENLMDLTPELAEM